MTLIEFPFFLRIWPHAALVPECAHACAPDDLSGVPTYVYREME